MMAQEPRSRHFHLDNGNTNSMGPIMYREIKRPALALITIAYSPLQGFPRPFCAAYLVSSEIPLVYPGGRTGYGVFLLSFVRKSKYAYV